MGFPKGGLEQVDQGCVLANALREWQQETGIPQTNLRVIPHKNFDAFSMGVRYVLALCFPGANSPDGAFPEAQSSGALQWPSPEANLRRV